MQNQSDINAHFLDLGDFTQNDEQAQMHAKRAAMMESLRKPMQGYGIAGGAAAGLNNFAQGMVQQKMQGQEDADRQQMAGSRNREGMRMAEEYGKATQPPVPQMPMDVGGSALDPQNAQGQQYGQVPTFGNQSPPGLGIQQGMLGKVDPGGMQSAMMGGSNGLFGM
jgi:hypothetical protein